MKETIKLIKPILLEGKNVSELDYDFDEITPALFAEAEAMKNKQVGSARFQGGATGTMELDYSFHLYLGMAAIIAINPLYTFEDMLQIKGKDVYTLMKVGRLFMTPSEELQEDNSEEQSETTAESSTMPATSFGSEASEDF
ncbi:MAG: hypothetical protein IJU77_11315 [Butyrivibrio sp.]|nr:hypothetical protein [Butyrivibrio sp.]